MPRKMAEFHEAFNHVALDYINLVRSQRNQDHLFLDVLGSLNMWSLECKLLAQRKDTFSHLYLQLLVSLCLAKDLGVWKK